MNYKAPSKVKKMQLWLDTLILLLGLMRGDKYII
jgi:hypothetical protein